MTHTKQKLFAAAASVGLMFGAAAFVAGQDGMTPRNDPAAKHTNDKHGSEMTPPTLPAGVKVKDSTDHRDLRKLLANATEAAFDKGGYDDIIGYLNDQDRDRISQVKIDQARREKFDGRIEQIRQAWKARYGEDFSIDVASEGEMGPFTNVIFLRGEIEDPALVVKSWPVNAHGAPVSATPGAAEEAQKVGGGDVNLDKGREVAIAYLPAMGMDRKSVTVSIVGEIQAWKIDVPNHVDGTRLYDNLLTHLTAFGENEANWPANKVEAQRKAAQCVMMALYDIPMKDPADRAEDSNQRQRQ